MSTSPAAVTGTETTRTGLRARASRVARSRRLAVLAALATGATLAATALPASAATNPFGFNFSKTTAVAGTNCQATVGTFYNTSDYPGTATEIQCSTGHSISVYTQLQDASMAGGLWYVWATTPTSNFSYTANTGAIEWYWASCGGPQLQWRVVAFVYVDGVYRGQYLDDGTHIWTPCH